MQIFNDYRAIIPEFELFREALHSPLPKHIRVNTLKEWSWKSEHNQKRIVDDFIEELRVHSERYA